MQRPDFDSIRDYAEFSKYYWYRDELIRICKAHGLKASGSKTELNKVVEAYFSGEKILPEKKSEKKQQVKTRKEMVKELTLDTGLLTCGFTFGNRFREFFRQQTGEEHFKFNVDMVASVKAVRETGDESFTLGDLLDIYYGKKTYAVYDRSALQWNKFVKDFCEDEATKIFKERLKCFLQVLFGKSCKQKWRKLNLQNGESCRHSQLTVTKGCGNWIPSRPALRLSRGLRVVSSPVPDFGIPRSS